MANSERITVAATATVIVDPPGDARTGGIQGTYVIRNKGAASIDLGGADVASGEGFELAAGESASFDLPNGESLYGITASGTCRVDVLRFKL